jgi:hypothetical protein
MQNAELDPETFMKLYVDETVKILERIFRPDKIVCYGYRVSILRSNLKLWGTNTVSCVRMYQ